MKRLLIVTAGLAMSTAILGGCEGGAQKSAADTAAAKTEVAPEYYEIRRDGKTYVLGSTDSLKAFNAGQMPKTKDVTLDNGKVITVESAGFNETNRLINDYKKQHGM